MLQSDRRARKVDYGPNTVIPNLEVESTHSQFTLLLPDGLRVHPGQLLGVETVLEVPQAGQDVGGEVGELVGVPQRLLQQLVSLAGPLPDRRGHLRDLRRLGLHILHCKTRTEPRECMLTRQWFWSLFGWLVL